METVFLPVTENNMELMTQPGVIGERIRLQKTVNMITTISLTSKIVSKS